MRIILDTDKKTITVPWNWDMGTVLLSHSSHDHLKASGGNSGR